MLIKRLAQSIFHKIDWVKQKTTIFLCNQCLSILRLLLYSPNWSHYPNECLPNFPSFSCARCHCLHPVTVRHNCADHSERCNIIALGIGRVQHNHHLPWVNILIFPIACSINNLGILTCKTKCSSVTCLQIVNEVPYSPPTAKS